MAINDVYRVEILGRLPYNSVENVFHVQVTEALGANPVQRAHDIVEWFDQVAKPDYLAGLSFGYTLRGHRSKRVNNGGGPNQWIVDGFSQGGRPGTLAISSAGPCLIWPYQHLGRWLTGRTFLPGYPANECINNRFVDGLLFLCQVFATGLIGAKTRNTTNFSVGIYLSHADLFFPFTSVTVSAKPGQQNGRLKPVL